MADRVGEAADRLYGLPLDEFTAERNAAAKELRDEGLKGEAERVDRARTALDTIRGS